MDRFYTDIYVAFRVVAGAAAAFWFNLEPIMHALVYLMALDIATGVLAAFITKQASSDASFRGMLKKAMILLLVAGAEVAGRMMGMGLPMGGVVAGFYCVHEIVSITENTARCNIPLPKQLVDALKKLQHSQAGGDEEPAAPRG